MNSQVLTKLKADSMPEIDWQARHGVELNNGERNAWYDQWFEQFAERVAAECAIVLAKVPHGVDASVWYANIAKFNKHLGIKP
jgi:hypothetical protein